MASTFPTSLDTIPDAPVAPALGGSTPTHPQMHDMLRDAIAAIETRIGITGSADHESIEYKIKGVVTAKTDSLTGRRTFSSSGIPSGAPVINGFVGADKPTIVYVRDHAYKQVAEQHAWLKANGLWPYSITLNTEVASALGGNSASPGGSDAVTWEQIAALQSDGVEVTNHTCRHIGSLRRVNTGFSLSYTGANGTATAYVTYTTGLDPVLHCVDSSDHQFNLTNASYDTLAELKTAVNALTGWTLTLAPELDGTEPSKYTLGVAVGNAKNCKSTTAMFAISGGLILRYKGSLAKTAFVRIRAQSALQLMMDGVSVDHLALNTGAYDTIAEVATYINGAAIGGGSAGDWECYSLDNEGVSSMSFVTGVETTLYTTGGFDTTPWRDALGQYVYLTIGMPIQEVWQKLLKAAKTTAAANNVTMKNFSDVGGKAPSLMMPSISDYNNLARVTAIENYIAPYAVPVDVAASVVGYGADNDTTSQTDASVVASLSALADSPGFVISPFLHHTHADGSSGYAFTNSASGLSNYQTEARMVAALAKIKELTDASSINVLTQQGLYEARQILSKPSNRLFNPRLLNGGASLVNANSDQGILIPGWELKTLSANVSACAVSFGKLSITTTVATTQTFLRQVVYLQSGKSYSFGANVNSLSYASGFGVGISCQPLSSTAAYEYRNKIPGSVGGFGLDDYIAYKSGSIERLMTVPAQERKGGYIRNVLNAWDDDSNKTWDLSVTKHIKVNIAGAGAVEIDCSSGAASASAVLAWEIASAINAAIKASATYKKFSEYFAIAKAENGYLIIESPYKTSDDNAAMIVVTAGTTTDATNKIFGTNPSWSDQPMAVASVSGAQGSVHPYLFSVVVYAVGTFQISGLHCSEIEAVF